MSHQADQADQDVDQGDQDVDQAADRVEEPTEEPMEDPTVDPMVDPMVDPRQARVVRRLVACSLSRRNVAALLRCATYPSLPG